MFYYPFSALLNTIIFIILCLIVIINNPKSKLNRSFCYFSISIIIWSFSYFLWQLSDNYNDALFWCRILSIGACFIPSTFLHFSLILIENLLRFNFYICTVTFLYCWDESSFFYPGRVDFLWLFKIKSLRIIVCIKNAIYILKKILPFWIKKYFI